MKSKGSSKKQWLMKIIALSLAMVTVLLLCTSCASKNAGEKDSGVVLPGNDGMYDANGYLLDDLGNDLDFGGTEVSFLCWSDRSMQEFQSDGINGDNINDKIYLRNLTVKERLKVNLKYTLMPGNYENSAGFTKAVESDVQSGNASYHIYGSYGPLGPTFAERGYSANMSTLSYLNFSKPWWPERIMSELSIANKLYFVTGDISTNLLWMMHGTFVNLTLLENSKIEKNPYQLVNEGEWTLEAMKEMAAGLYKDNGDGVKTADDVFGYTVHQNVLEAFVIGCGIKAVEKDKSDLPVISSSYRGEKMINLVDSLGSWLNSSPDVWMENGFTNARQMFEDGRALFITDKAYIVTTGLKDIKDTYGFLPMPKYDKGQTDYFTDIGNTHTVYSISSASNEEKINTCAAVVECLASESYRQVMPMVFETTMKSRYSENSDASRMYDIMRRTITFDFGKVFSFIIGSEGCEVYKIAIFKNSGGWSSTFNSIRPKLKNALDDIIESFSEQK